MIRLSQVIQRKCRKLEIRRERWGCKGREKLGRGRERRKSGERETTEGTKGFRDGWREGGGGS